MYIVFFYMFLSVFCARSFRERDFVSYTGFYHAFLLTNSVPNYVSYQNSAQKFTYIKKLLVIVAAFVFYSTLTNSHYSFNNFLKIVHFAK